MRYTGPYRSFFATLLCCLITQICVAQTARLCVDLKEEGEELMAFVSLQGDVGIISAQFTVNWDPNLLSFLDVNSEHPTWDVVPEELTFNTNSVDEGNLRVVWTTADLVNGDFYEFGDTVFSIRFNRLGSDEASVLISNDPLGIEIGGNNGALKVETKDGLSNGALIRGTLFVTENGQCDFDSSQTVLNQWQVAAISKDGRIYRTFTDEMGEYYFILPAGSFSLETVFPNRSWTQCQILEIENIDSSNQNINIGVVATRTCSDLEVGISGFHLESCQQNKYAVNYRNWGTSFADSAYIEISIDTLLNIISVSRPYLSIDNQSIRIDLGQVGVNEQGSIELILESDCNLLEGQIHCMEAEIFPNKQCEIQNEEWSGASLEVTGRCEGDSVIFTVRNIGTANMVSPSPFIITEDIVSFLKGNVQLNSLSSKDFPYEANGKTYRMEVEQVPFHPGNSIPRAHVEGCGPEPYTYGIVNQFEQNDRDPHLSKICLRTRTQYLPAELTANPIGVSDERYIESSTELEYSIGFQNTGSTIIGDIEVIDTLSEFLDPKTIRLTGSSHLLKMAFLSDRVIKFSFPDINLSPFESEEENSRGFLQFRVKQIDENENGTMIHNRALLRFDRDGLTTTEQLTHTVSDNFFQTLGFYPLEEETFFVKAFPNPFHEQTRILVTAERDDIYTIELFDVLGNKLLEDKFSFEYVLNNPGWAQGLYLAKITNSDNDQLVGKLYIR